MDDFVTMTAARLRARAENCRRIARTAKSTGIARELCSLAEEYEADAGRLEVPVQRRRDRESRPSLN